MPPPNGRAKKTAPRRKRANDRGRLKQSRERRSDDDQGENFLALLVLEFCFDLVLFDPRKITFEKMLLSVNIPAQL